MMNLLVRDEGRFFYEHAFEGKSARIMIPIITVKPRWLDCGTFKVRPGDTLNVTYRDQTYVLAPKTICTVTGFRLVDGKPDWRFE